MQYMYLYPRSIFIRFDFVRSDSALQSRVGVRFRDRLRESFGNCVIEERFWVRETAIAGGSEVVSDGTEISGNVTVLSARSSGQREFDHIAFELHIERCVLVFLFLLLLTLIRLVVSERPHHIDGGRRGIGTREEIEPSCDENIGCEYMHVCIRTCTILPRFLVCQSSSESETVVDELHTGSALFETVTRSGASMCSEHC